MPKNFHCGKEKKLCTVNDIAKINGAITKRCVTDKQLAVYFYETYQDFAKKNDALGRTALHMAASCGRNELCQWLINVAGANINQKDFESGYIPLQRALFHGHINAAIRLLQAGSDPTLVDKEGLTSLDLVVKDRPKQIEINLLVPCQVYIWGSNDNYTLGTGTNTERKSPDLLDNFKRKNFSIKQICMDEFHSVFVSRCSNIWVCGNGQGGRLGIPTDRHVLTPKILGIGGEKCVMAATAVNHTLMLLSNGTVLACGQNEFHQLGVKPATTKECLTPKPVSFQNLSEQLLGICAGKYHSVFYGKTSLFTCGLNGGQLGQPNSESSYFIKVPIQVPVNLKPGSCITHVSSSTSCVAFSLSSGEIYTLYQFKFNKIATKQLDVCQIATSGGTFQSKLINESNGALKVVLLYSGGTIQIWQETNPNLKRCMFGLSRLISISHIFLTDTKILFTTKDGEAYHGTIGQLSKQTVNYSREEKSGFHKFIERSECYHISSNRISNVHRAVSIICDPKGKNMAVIQAHPHNALTNLPVQSYENVTYKFASLLDESSETDNIHDILFKVQKTIFSAHEYIIACNTSTFLTIPRQGKFIEISDIHPSIFTEIMSFMYTGWCSLLNEGPVKFSLSSSKDDPVKLLTEACSKYKVSNLYSKIVCFRFENGCVELKNHAERPILTPCQYRRDMFPELYDIQVSSADGKLFDAHKCVLVARLDYFHNMLMGGWLESVTTPVLHMDCQSSTLEIFLDFLYTNEISESYHSECFDIFGRLLVMSDQLLCSALKEYCEVSLVKALNLKNVATMLQLAFLYNTNQLKKTVMEFISLNLETIIENRSLEELSDEILQEVDKFHRNFHNDVYDRRIITPYFSQTISDEEILSSSADSWPENLITHNPDMKDEKHLLKNMTSISKKRTPIKKPQTVLIEPEVIEEPIKQVQFKKEFSTENIACSPPDNDLLFSSFNFPSTDDDLFLKTLSQKSKHEDRKHFPPINFKKFSNQKKPSVPTEESVAPKPQFKGWAKLSPPNNDEICERNQSSSSPQTTSFVEIIASEQQAKNNYFKMREKSFVLTQMEDKAIEELCEFYNASGIYEERITVLRVTSSNIPKPTWIKSNKRLFN